MAVSHRAAGARKCRILTPWLVFPYFAARNSAALPAQTIGVFMATTAVTDATFDNEVKKAGVPVLVDFWAEWCGPCRMVAPILEDLAKELAGQIKIVKVDVDNNQGVAAAYNIRSIPSLLLFKNGQVISQKLGAMPKHQLKAWLTEAVAVA
jgi:thioredoxin 1